ncbi:MAG: phosphoribosylamine--glycine ligase [Thermodesulfobacteriota bacterium]
MKILVVGGGGREHALVWKIAQSPKVSKIYCAPGNAGIGELAECLPIKAGNIPELVRFACKEKIDLTVVGPEDPLTGGLVDALEKKGLKAFGPTKKAAMLEASKDFAKRILTKYHIPTAASRTFTEYKKALAYVGKMGAPIVVKADGLAAGKGVMVCQTVAEAKAAIEMILIDKAFGTAGDKVLLEECLIGEEASFLAFSDGRTVVPLPTSQDHKPIYDNDQGPNTGGMGAYSPAPVVHPALFKKAMDTVMVPTIQAMAREGRLYKGVLYAGLMIHEGEIRVLEFNVRFGDPEAQPLLMRLRTDLLEIMEAVLEGRLHKINIEWDQRPAVCVVMAEQGYPGLYKKGHPVLGLDRVKHMKDVVAFQAGTALKDKTVLTDGGRVLGVTALGEDIPGAIKKAYQAVGKIHWDSAFFRTDIGQKALRLLERTPSSSPQVGIVMGSDSDLPIMEKAAEVLKGFKVSYEMLISSAHRSPQRTAEFARQARAKGFKVLIAGAGAAAHLAGVLAAETTLPVIAVPIDSSSLKGLDALLAMVQMPAGIPVATMAIGSAGAKNAAVLAVQILSLSSPALASALKDYKKRLEKEVEEKDKKAHKIWP